MDDLKNELYSRADCLLTVDKSLQLYLDRGAVLQRGGYDVEVIQRQFVHGKDVERLKEIGAQALATPEWFEQASLISGQHNAKRQLSQLWIDAAYPIEAFDDPHLGGPFTRDDDGNTYYIEQYPMVNTWDVEGKKVDKYFYVDAEQRKLASFDKTTALHPVTAYNEVYRQYITDLAHADASVWYDRNYDAAHATNEERIAWRAKKEKLYATGRTVLRAVLLRQVLHSGVTAPTRTETAEDFVSFLVLKPTDGDPHLLNLTVPLDGELHVIDYTQNDIDDETQYKPDEGLLEEVVSQIDQL